jgi:hypothetical protein
MERTKEAGIGWIRGHGAIWINTESFKTKLGIKKNTLKCSLRRWGLALTNKERLHIEAPEPQPRQWKRHAPGPLRRGTTEYDIDENMTEQGRTITTIWVNDGEIHEFTVLTGARREQATRIRTAELLREVADNDIIDCATGLLWDGLSSEDLRLLIPAPMVI